MIVVEKKLKMCLRFDTKYSLKEDNKIKVYVSEKDAECIRDLNRTSMRNVKLLFLGHF
jgi:hypothetical protein